MPAGDQVGVGDAAGPGQSFGIHDHDKDPEGGVLSPAVNKNTLGDPHVQPAYPEAFPFPLMGMYGDGSDGDFDCAGLTVLTKDMNFRNLHVFTGGILYTAGFIVRVWGKLTIDAGPPAGIMCCDGFDGALGNERWAGGGAGGIGATRSVKFRSTFFPGFLTFDGGGGGGAAAPGKNTAAGGAAVVAAIVYYPLREIYQAQGGSGGGAIGAAPLAPLAGAVAPWAHVVGKPSVAGGPSIIIGIGVAAQIGGGGGGGGGGEMEFWANEIDNAGRITCRGGKGGNGYFKTIGAATSISGNGSGGNGGLLRGFYRKASGAGLGVIDSLGGAVGGPDGNGGGPGEDGYAEVIQVGA